MKKFFFACVIFLVLLFGVVKIIMLVKLQVKRDLVASVIYPATRTSPTEKLLAFSSPVSTSVFVPSWTLKPKNTFGGYDAYIYFGDVEHIADFMSSAPENKVKLLVIRMLDSDEDIAVLKNSAKQNSVISEAITTAKKHRFTGIVLDFELQALPFDALVNQINTFVSAFYLQAKENNFTFAMTVYGDTFFRLRPFDVKALSHHVDHFMIMSYD